MELTGGAQPVLAKQLRFDSTIWKTCQGLLMELQSRNMHQWMEFPYFKASLFPEKFRFLVAGSSFHGFFLRFLVFDILGPNK
jgi:hypothetical protein